MHGERQAEFKSVDLDVREDWGDRYDLTDKVNMEFWKAGFNCLSTTPL
jgi:hypothetical protein